MFQDETLSTTLSCIDYRCSPPEQLAGISAIICLIPSHEALVGVSGIKGEWPKTSRDQGSNWKKFRGSGEIKNSFRDLGSKIKCWKYSGDQGSNWKNKRNFGEKETKISGIWGDVNFFSGIRGDLGEIILGRVEKNFRGSREHKPKNLGIKGAGTPLGPGRIP